MKSKITIDVDFDNQPVIQIDYIDSPDVRDKLVKKFMETFGGSPFTFTTWSYFKPDATTIKLRPVPPEIVEFRYNEGESPIDAYEVAVDFQKIQKLRNENN